MTQPRPPGVPDPGSRPPKIDVGTGTGNAILTGINVAAAATDQSPFGAVTGLGDTLIAARAWVADRHNWVRVMWFGGGVICFAIGAAMLAGRPATQAVATVIPAGKAVKAVTGARR